jgi:hypothetical protein
VSQPIFPFMETHTTSSVEAVREVRKRCLIMAILAVFLVFSGGTFGYYFLCDGERLLVD